MTLSLLLSAAMFSFVTSVTPGPNNTFLLSSGVNFGLKKSLPYLMGIMAGLCGMMLAIGLGIGVVFTTFPVVYQVLKYIGFAYIVYLAYLIVMSTSKSETAEAKYIGFWKSTSFQFVNPKAWIVLASYMATFVPVEAGWFDAVLVRQTVKTSGISGIALTKLDILDGFPEIKVCVRYMLDGQEIDRLPASQAAQARVQPVYETIEGWSGTTAGARSWADLPAQAIKYIQRVQELIETPVALVSTSPEREDTILVRDPFVD